MDEDEKIVAPRFVQPHDWTWRSYTDGAEANATVLMVGPCARGGFQFLVRLPWDDFDPIPEHGREDAEALAKYICAKLNVPYNGETR